MRTSLGRLVSSFSSRVPVVCSLFILIGIFLPVEAGEYWHSRFTGYRDGFIGTPFFATAPEATKGFGTGSVTLAFPSQVKADAAPGYKVRFTEPFRGTITVSYEYNNQGEDPVTLYADLKAGDDTIFGSLFCNGKSSVTSIAKKSRGSVSMSCSFTATELKAYNQHVEDGRLVTSSTIALNARAIVSNGDGDGVYIEGQYKNFRYGDSVSIESPVPPSMTRLEAGSKVTLAALAKYRLESRDKGKLALRAYDRNTGTLVAAGSSVSVPVSPPATTVAASQLLEIKDATIPLDSSALQISASLYDESESVVLAESAYIYFGVNGCPLFGTIQRIGKNQQYWLPGVPMRLFEIDGSTETLIAETVSEFKGESWAPRAEYCFRPAQPISSTKQYRIKALMQDAVNEKDSKFLISPTGDASAAELRWRPFMKSGLVGGARLDLDASASGNLDTLLDGRGEPLPQDLALAAAESYWHMWRQIYLPVTSGVPVSRNLPIEVYLNQSPPSHYCATDAGTSCTTASAIHLSSADSVPNANPSVIWHEYGHHVVTELYGTVIPRPQASADPVFDRAHNGFANDYTSSSLDEGFATFWAALSSRAFEPDAPYTNEGMFRWNEPSPEMSQPIHLEVNEKVTAEGRGEELGIAGILWDLVDTMTDWYASDIKDDITLLPSEVISALTANKPRSLLALYNALSASYPAIAQKDENGLSKLDQIFLLSHAFHDRNGNGLWDVAANPKEEIGKAANGTPWTGYIKDNADQWKRVTLNARPGREDVPQIPGSQIEVTLLGEDGKTPSSTKALVDLSFEAPFEFLNQTRKATLTAGRLYLELPPARYPVTARIRVPGSTGPDFLIDSRAYWTSVPSLTTPTFASQTFTVPVFPSITSLSVSSGAIGTPVTIKGQGFSATAQENVIKFGETAASVLAATETELKTRVPEGLAAGSTTVSVTAMEKPSDSVKFRVLAPKFSIQATSLEFGTVEVGKKAESGFTITNTGDAPLTVLGMTSPDSSYSCSSGCPPYAIWPGSKQDVIIRYSPTSAGNHDSFVFVTTDDRVERVAAVAVWGTAFASESTPEQIGLIDFGKVATGQSRTATISYTNTDSVPLLVSFYGATDNIFLLTTPSPFSIPAGATQTLSFKFAPTASLVKTGTVTLFSKRNLTVAVRGEGVSSPPSSTCAWAVSPGSVNVPATGGSGVLSITAGTGCAWGASSSAPFVAVAPASGSGNGTLNWAVQPNSTVVARTASISVGQHSIPVTQSEGELKGEALVPIVLSSAGSGGSFFTSELTFTNRGTMDVVATITYEAAPNLGTGSGSAVDVIPAGSQLVFPDAMGYLRSLGIPLPRSGNRGGTLRIEFQHVSSPAVTTATVRTASVVPEGRAGLAYGSVSPQGLQRAGTAWVCGLRQTQYDRSNLALVNAGKAEEGWVGLKVTVFSGDPGARASVSQDFYLPPGGFQQLSKVLQYAGANVTNGYAKIERTAGNAPWWAYGTIADEVNSDGSYLPALAETNLAGKQGVTVPVIIDIPPYSSELIATNFSSARKTIRLKWVAETMTTADHTASFPLELAPGQQMLIPELGKYFRERGVLGVPSGSVVGALFATVDGGDTSGVFLGGRTSSPGGGGRYGVAYGAVPWGTAKQTAWLMGLQQDEENRSNLAVVNNGDVDGSESVFQVALYDGATGKSVQTVTMAVPARGWKQEGTILARYAPGVKSGYAKITKVSGKNSFLAYGVVNDGASSGQRSGDGAFIEMSSVDESP